MNSPKPSPELLRLLAAWCDDSITDDEVRRLNDLLKNNPAAQHTFARFTAANASLEQLGPDGSVSVLDNVITIPVEKRPNRWKTTSWAAGISAAAAAVTLLITAPYIQNPSPEPEAVAHFGSPVTTNEEEGIAVIAHAIGAEWPRHVRPIRAGATLKAGRIELDEGFLHLQFYNGVKVVLEGPIDFEIQSIEEAFCRRGTLHAHIPQHAFGFVVHTPGGQVIDYGTQFGLEVFDDGSTEVHVFEGEVEFRSYEEETLAYLTSGRAARIDVLGRHLPLLADEDRFASDRQIRELHALQMETRVAKWYGESQQWRNHSNLLAYYDFDRIDYSANTIPASSADPYADGLDGVLVGCRWTNGRWPGKGALSFTRPSDRIRIRIPGFHDALTLAAWARLDRLGDRRQSLLMSDGFEPESVHWQIDGLAGTLSLTTRLDEETWTDYASDPVIDDQVMGQWVHLACVYDRMAGEVRHYLNGEQIGKAELRADVQLRIGIAEIGNWAGLPGAERREIRHLVGDVDEFIVFRKALSPEAIARLAATGDPG